MNKEVKLVFPISDQGYENLIKDVIDGIVEEDFRVQRLFLEQSELSKTIFERWTYDIDYTNGSYHIALQNDNLGECADVEMLNIFINKQLETMDINIHIASVEIRDEYELELEYEGYC